MNYRNIILASILVISLAGAVVASAANTKAFQKNNGKLGCTCASGQCQGGNCAKDCKGTCATAGACNCGKGQCKNGNCNKDCKGDCAKSGCNCAKGQCKNGGCVTGCKGSCAKGQACSGTNCQGGCKGNCSGINSTSTPATPKKSCGCGKK